MSYDFDFQFERYEEYYGDAAEVKKMLEECPTCGTRMIHSHISDYKNLIIQETSKCPECGTSPRKYIHTLN